MRLAWQREVYGTWRTQATDQALVLAALILSLVPLWLFKYTPAAHWPDHVAVSSVLYRLLHHDPAITQFYTLNDAVGTYPLLYVVLTPCVGWFGPFVGGKIVLSGIAVSCVGAVMLCCHALDRPRILGIGGIFLFYGAIFFWGFATTLIGVPLVIFTLWGLLRCMASRHTGWVVLTGIFAALAASAHGVCACAMAAAVLSYALAAPKRHVTSALLILLVGLVPIAPWLWHHGWPMARALLEQARVKTPATTWNHLRAYLAAFDRGLGRAGHHGLVLLLLVWMLLPKARAYVEPGRMLRWFALFSLGCFMLLPAELPAWAGGRPCNVRYLTFLEVGMILACVEPASLTMRRALRYGMGMCFVLFLTGLVTLWQSFDATARPLDEVMDLVPERSTLAVHGPAPDSGDIRVPLASRLSAYCLTWGVACEDDALDDAESPVRPRRVRSTRISPLAMGEFDYVLLQGHAADRRGPAVQGGHLIKEAGIWQLYQRL